MMWRRLLLLDLALVAVLMVGVLQVEKSWKEFDAAHRIESVKPEKEPARTLPLPPALTGTPEDWTEISTKDAFSFDRNDVSIVAPKQEAAAKPKPVLYGVMSVGSEWIAMHQPFPVFPDPGFPHHLIHFADLRDQGMNSCEHINASEIVVGEIESGNLET